ncbi:hypothetical protein PCE1_000506 [Barthelona sp. PCE]
MSFNTFTTELPALPRRLQTFLGGGRTFTDLTLVFFGANSDFSELSDKLLDFRYTYRGEISGTVLFEEEFHRKAHETANYRLLLTHPEISILFANNTVSIAASVKMSQITGLNLSKKQRLAAGRTIQIYERSFKQFFSDISGLRATVLHDTVFSVVSNTILEGVIQSPLCTHTENNRIRTISIEEAMQLPADEFIEQVGLTCLGVNQNSIEDCDVSEVQSPSTNLSVDSHAVTTIRLSGLFSSEPILGLLGAALSADAPLIMSVAQLSSQILNTQFLAGFAINDGTMRSYVGVDNQEPK